MLCILLLFMIRLRRGIRVIVLWLRLVDVLLRRVLLRRLLVILIISILSGRLRFFWRLICLSSGVGVMFVVIRRFSRWLRVLVMTGLRMLVELVVIWKDS